MVFALLRVSLKKDSLETEWNQLFLLCRSAFFYGQIEVQRRGLMSWLPKLDLQVIVAINGTGVTVIDPLQSVYLH